MARGVVGDAGCVCGGRCHGYRASRQVPERSNEEGRKRGNRGPVLVSTIYNYIKNLSHYFPVIEHTYFCHEILIFFGDTKHTTRFINTV